MKRTKITSKKLTDRQKVELMKALLLQIQKKHLYEPNSDWHQYCPSCGCSPYNTPPHSDGCLVEALQMVLKRVQG